MIYRKSKGKQWVYYYNNKLITNPKKLERIRKLCIPPMWINVEINSNPSDKVQAMGIDKKGRKQYIYHDTWIKNSSDQKYLRMAQFIKAIPKLLKKLQQDYRLDDDNKLKILAIMVKIIKMIHIRIGSDIYAKENKSYGLTTLEKRHVIIENDNLCIFKFKGKSGIDHKLSLRDKMIKDTLKYLLKIKGNYLFQYKQNNIIYKISSKCVNNYINSIMGKNFTAKDFRTYGANYNFLKYLMKCDLGKSKKDHQYNIKKALHFSSKKLGNTETICKKSYVMKFLIDKYYENPEEFHNIKKKSNENNIDNFLFKKIIEYKKVNLNNKRF